MSREGPTSHTLASFGTPGRASCTRSFSLGAANSDRTLRGSVCGTRSFITVHTKPPQTRWVPGAT